MLHPGPAAPPFPAPTTPALGRKSLGSCINWARPAGSGCRICSPSYPLACPPGPSIPLPAQQCSSQTPTHHPHLSASSLCPVGGLGSQLLFHCPALFRGPKREFLIKTDPQSPFLPPRSPAGPGARVGGSQQRLPGISAVMRQHEIRLSVLLKRGRKSSSWKGRSTEEHRWDGVAAQKPQTSLLSRQNVSPFLSMPPYPLC